MGLLYCVLALSVPAMAGTVHGVVLEQASGRPLARTVVRLDAVRGSEGQVSSQQSFSVRSTRSGQFVFPSVVPGVYLLSAARAGYFPAGHGQRLPAGRPTPIEIAADSVLFSELRMRRKGAITGRVLDENGVGAMGAPVVAYRARLPLRVAASAVSDDRGVYRIHGLEPGKYWVRSAPHTLEDGSSWLPTFGPGGREIRDARIHAVIVDGESAYADISPDAGTLFPIGGAITCDKRVPVSVAVSLSSETGVRQTNAICSPNAPGAYRFEGLAPGVYEIHAAVADGSATAFVEMLIQRPFGNIDLSLAPAYPVQVEVRRAGSTTTAVELPVKLAGRRQDLAAAEALAEIAPGRTPLGAGYWELRAQPPSGHYVESIVNLHGAGRRDRRLDGPPKTDNFEVFVDSSLPARLRVSVSDRAAQISGRVAAEGKGIAGAPVFLWPVTVSARRPLGGAPQTLTDTGGRFRFENLPPGRYRVLASFDLQEVDEQVIEASQAPVIELAPSEQATVELAPWLAPW